MTLETIFEKVAEIIHKSVGYPQQEIKLDDTLFEKIGVDSIDMVDILFELETAFSVELKISDFEARARQEMKDEPYEIDGVITPKGIEAIKNFMPEIDQNKLVEGITVHQLIKLFTVQSLCKMILHKLEESKTVSQ